MLSRISVNTFIYLNNLVIAPMRARLIGDGFSWAMLILPASILIMTVTTFAMNMLLGVMTCRYRDVASHELINAGIFFTQFYGSPSFYRDAL